MKHEMTAREFFQTKHRMCRKYFHNPRGWDDPSCPNCPIRGRGLCFNDDPELEKTIAIVAEWATAHPEETLEPLGNNIYFDPKHRIVADEIVRVTTIEMTQVVPKEFIEAIGNHEITQDKIEEYKDGLRELFMLRHGPDDLHIKVQQFVTKGHEEEV